MTYLKKLFIFILVSFNINTATAAPLDKPLTIEYYNGGGYVAYFRTYWKDKDTGELMAIRSPNKSFGQYYTQVIPAGTDLSTVEVEGFSLTGLVSNKTKQIFKYVVQNTYEFEGEHYLGIHAYHTTLHPRYGEYDPRDEELDVTNPAQCLDLIISDTPAHWYGYEPPTPDIG